MPQSQWIGIYTMSDVTEGDITIWHAAKTEGSTISNTVKVSQKKAIASSCMLYEAKLRIPEYSIEKYPSDLDYVLHVSSVSNLMNMYPVTCRSMVGSLLC